MSGCSCSFCDVCGISVGRVDHITVESVCGLPVDERLIRVTSLR
jgi:hypothetical protein